MYKYIFISLLLIVFASDLVAQVTIKRMDLTHPELGLERARMARTVLMLLENDTLALMEKYIHEEVKQKELKKIVKQIKKQSAIFSPIPIVTWDSTRSTVLQYSRAYYSRKRSSNEFLFEILIEFDEHPYDLRAKHISLFKTERSNRSITAVSGRRRMPPGAPAIGAFRDKDFVEFGLPVRKQIIYDLEDGGAELVGIDRSANYAFEVHLKYASQKKLDTLIIWKAKGISLLNIYEHPIDKIDSIPSKLGQLDNLTELSIRLSSATKIPKEIGKLKNLRKLSLNLGQNREIPAEIGSLSSLKELRMGGDEVTALPEEIKHLKNLEKLFIYGNGITRLPEGIGELENLKEIELRTENIEVLPRTMGKLKKLKRIVFYQTNKLRLIPKELSRIDSLEELRFMGVKVLPSPEVGMKNIRHLWIEKAAEDISSLDKYSNLVHLEIRSGAFSEMPDVDFRKLEKLKMHRCVNLQRLPPSFDQCRELREVAIYASRLESFPEALLKCKRLQRINMSNNSITDLPAAIGDLEELSTVILENNKISAIPMNILKLKNCNYIQLSGNNIMEVPSEILNYQGETKMLLTLRNNPIDKNKFRPNSTIRIVF